MGAFLTVYARAVGAIGSLLLIAALVVDTRWIGRPVWVASIAVAVVALRMNQIPLTKYGALNLLGIPAIAGALIIGAPATLLALWLGMVIADAFLLRKGYQIAWVNAGREVLALMSAYGVFGWATQVLGGGNEGLSVDLLPALALFMLAYFLTSRLLLYFTLILRDKLLEEETSLILRYEVIAFGAGSIAVGAMLLTATSLPMTFWPVIGIVLGGIGLLTKRILEESIAAEELNKICLLYTSPSPRDS